MFPNVWSHSVFARFRGSAQLRGSLCIAIPMQACTQWTHSDVWSQLATTPECLFKVGGRQSEKKRWNGDRRPICSSTCGIDAGRGVIRHRGVSDSSDGARPLWRSQSAQTEKFFADGLFVCVCARVQCHVNVLEYKEHYKTAKLFGFIMQVTVKWESESTISYEMCSQNLTE